MKTRKGYHLDKDGFMKGLNNEHTPTPLICTCKYQRDKSAMHEGDCNTSREIPYPPEVVRAVNSHEMLLETLQRSLTAFERYLMEKRPDSGELLLLKDMREAIAKADGKGA